MRAMNAIASMAGPSANPHSVRGVAEKSAAWNNVEDYVGAEPKQREYFCAVARLERRCRELRANAHRVESAPFSIEHARQRAHEIVQGLAQRGAPNVPMLIEHEHGEITWPLQTLQSRIFNAEGQRPIGFAEVPDTIATLAWLFGDVMVKRWTA